VPADDSGAGASATHGRLLATATHPAVIWQSHLLDVTPASWPSMKARAAAPVPAYFYF
jgi:hypothetical protein